MFLTRIAVAVCVGFKPSTATRTPRYISGQTLMAVSIRAGLDDIEAGAPKPLFKLPAPSASVTSSYDVGKEGRMFLVRQPLESPQPLQLIENWPGLLRNPGLAGSDFRADRLID